MGILDSILANGGNVKLALEDQEILQALDGDASVDDATQLALSKAAADQSPDPVAVSTQDVLTVSNELSEELQGTDEAEDMIVALENISFALKRAKNPLDLAIAYESYSALCKATHLPAPKALSVEALDSDLEGQRQLALEGIDELKSKLMGLVGGSFERVAKLLTKAGQTTAMAGKEQSIRTKSLLGGLFGSRNWDPEATVTVPKSGIENYGQAATNPSEFAMIVVSSAGMLFDGGDSAWSEFVNTYLDWSRSGSSDVSRFSTYKVPDKLTAKLPLRPRVEKNTVVFDKPVPVTGDVVVKVGDKKFMKELLSYSTIIARILTEMDKYFGNFENHWSSVKKNLEDYIESKADDEYFQKRVAVDYREIERRIEAAVAFFVAMAKYLVEVNAFLLEFATAAIAAAEAKK